MTDPRREESLLSIFEQRDPASEAIAAQIRAAQPDGATWLEQAIDDLGKGDPGDPNDLLRRLRVAVARCRRKLGEAPLASSPALNRDVPDTWNVGRWTSTDAGRWRLLDAAVSAPGAPDPVELVTPLLRRGSLDEQISIVRVIVAMPGPERFVDVIVDACRTNAQSLFEAIACDNPYPARYFSDAAFRQMVLKAIFMGVPVRRILRLDDRTDEELVRMVDAFASERRAAGRSVPEDIDYVKSRLETR